MFKESRFEKNIGNLNFILFFIMLFSLAFDYRSIDGSLIVIVLGLVNVVVGFLLILSQRQFNKKVFYLISFFWLFAIITSLVGILRGQGSYSVLAQILPFVIFCNTAIIYASFIHRNDDFVEIVKLSIWVAIFSMIWKPFFAIYYYSLNFTEVRYQIISGACIFLFAYGLSCIITKKNKNPIISIISIIFPIIIVLVSVTRTYIFVFFLMLILGLFLFNVKRGILIFLKSGVLFSIVICISLFIFPEAGDRWFGRLFNLKQDGLNDLTSLTRLAEINGQIYHLKNDFLGLLFGLGIAAKTEWMGDAFYEVLLILGSNFEGVGGSYGHNVYVGLIYVGGLVFGMPIIILLLSILFLSIFKFKKNHMRMSEDKKHLLLFSILSVFGYSLYGVLGGTFGDRSMALFYGISFGILLSFVLGYSKNYDR